MTEKRRPTHSLAAFQAASASGKGFAVTTTALRSAAALGCGREEMRIVIAGMEPRQFRKSMTSHADHRRWQDVYHVPSEFGLLYVKFTAEGLTAFTLLSFKEKDDG